MTADFLRKSLQIFTILQPTLHGNFQHAHIQKKFLALYWQPYIPTQREKNRKYAHEKVFWRDISHKKLIEEYFQDLVIKLP